MPVKISDALMVDARVNAELTNRSIAGQVEHWARLGKSVESIMRVPAVAALKERAALTLNESVAQIGTSAGQYRLNKVLQRKPYPHYEAVQDRPEFLIRTGADGTRVIGRFVGRQFVEG